MLHVTFLIYIAVLWMLINNFYTRSLVHGGKDNGNNVMNVHITIDIHFLRSIIVYFTDACKNRRQSYKIFIVA